MKKFTVTAERTPDRKWWILEEPTLGAVSQVRHLSDAEAEMREAIAYLAEANENEIEISVQVLFSSEIKSVLSRMQEAKEVEKAAQQLAQQASIKAVKTLQNSGYTQREVAKIIGISHQRVSQLANA